MKIFLLTTLLLASPLSVTLGQTMENDSLKHLLSATPPDTTRLLLLMQLAYNYRFFQPDSAIMLAKQAVQLAQRLHFVKNEENALNIIGETMRSRGELPQALETHFRALRISQSNHDPEGEASSMTYIGLVYVEMREHRQGLHYLLQASEIFERLSNKLMGSFTLSNIGDAYVKINRLDSALFFQQKAYALSIGLGSGNLTSLVLTRLGIVEGRLGNPDRALDYYRQALSNTYLTGDLLNRCGAQYQIAELYHQREQPDSSLHYARQAFVNSQRVSDKTVLLQVSSLLVKLYQATGNLDSAFHYQQEAMAAKDSLFGPEKFQRLQLLTLTEQQSQQRLREEQARSRAQFQRIGLLSALGVFLLIALLLWRNNRQQRRANQSLNQKNHQIETQRNALEQTLAELQSTQAQLIQKEKMASLGELTAGIAHEIQNPLNFVNNFSEVSSELVEELREEWRKEDRKPEIVEELFTDLQQNLSKIHHHGQRADSIVKGMLQHSRASTGEKQSTDLNALVEEYLRLSYHGLRAKDKDFNATLTTDLDPQLGKVAVVPQEVGRVLLNLFNNAFQATQQQKARLNGSYQSEVTVSTRKVGNRVEIRVKDNGTGIPEALKSKIFQPFFTTKPAGQGTGLGLSLSYDIITKGHGGELKVESQEGQYTEFIITLPG